MMTDFLEVIIVACLAVTLYFGGWQVPWLGSGRVPLSVGRGVGPAAASAVVILQVLVVQPQGPLFCGFQVLIRWTYPRLRYDQLMDLGWKVLVPLGFLNILGTGLLVSVRR